jgi:hypothetical protein
VAQTLHRQLQRKTEEKEAQQVLPLVKQVIVQTRTRVLEGRIASLRRDYGWRKSRYHGQDGMERWLGLG